jgi:acetate kinase
MLILVLNSGSSSLKYKLIRMPEEHLLHSGRIEKIGEKGATWSFQKGQGISSSPETIPCTNHDMALEQVFSVLVDAHKGCLNTLEDIGAIGHRVVHGRDIFGHPLLVNAENLTSLNELIDLAPLHLPANLACIQICLQKLALVPQVAVFDTAFFRNLPKETYLYPVPLEWSQQFGIRRYGFHGISYDYVTQETSRILSKPLTDLKLIATHLGNGTSMMAFIQGYPLDTSMGFTPLEGLMMGTRSGTIDAAIIPYVMKKTQASLDEIMNILNHHSGLTAISGMGRDLRSILTTRAQGDMRAELAFNMFIHSLKKCLGAYFLILRGIDALIFTGGIGENAPEVRAALLEGLSFLGLEIDAEKNAAHINGRTGLINSPLSPVKILVIPTDEEILIARSTYQHLTK